MSTWKEYRFSEMLVDESISYGIVQPGAHTEIDSVPIIRVNNIKNGNIKTNDVLKVASSIEEKYQRTRLSGGELLITVVGSVGECAIVPTTLAGWNVARAVSVAKIKEKFDKRFVKYTFKTEDVIFQIYGNTNDTVQPTLNLSSLKEIRLKLPTLPEQKAIASVLSSLDDKIDLLHRQNKTLEAMAETLFRQWFVEEADSDEVTTLGEFAQNVRENAKVEDLGKFNHYVGLEHIPRKCLALSSWGKPDELESNKSVFIEKDILFGKLRSYFHKVVFAPINGVCSTDILVIRPKKEEWFSFCLFWFFNKDVVEYSDLGSGGTKMPRTNWEVLSTYPIPKPDIAAIEEFDEIIRPMTNKISFNICQIHTLEKLRDTLLPKLISGEVRV
jgi:type I restriction enzyme S subunit